MPRKLKLSFGKVFTSIEKASNWLKELKQLVKQRAKPEEAFPITTATESERKKFLLYGISLLNPKDYPTDQRGKIVMFKTLLQAEVMGYSIEYIANQSRCSLDTAKRWRRDAIECVKDAINDRIKHGIPVVGLN